MLVIFSVCQNKNTFLDQENSLVTLQKLDFLGLSPSIVEGCYTHYDGTQVREMSFLVETNSLDEMFQLENIMRRHDQESYLIIDEGKCNLVDLKTHDETPIGQWTEVPKNTALEAPAYTKTTDGSYWIAA